jgi:hypothetical protein
MGSARMPEQRAGKSRVVEDRVDAFVSQARLERSERLARIMSQNSRRELRIIARQPMTGVGENHHFPPCHLFIHRDATGGATDSLRRTKAAFVPALACSIVEPG